MRQKVLILIFTFAIGIALGAMGNWGLNAQQELVERTVLLKTDLAGIEGKEGIVMITEFNPQATTGSHYHHGHEFAYVLEGSGTFEVEGRPPATFKPGDIFHIPPRQVHNVKNDGPGLVKALVFVVHEKGEPLAVSVK